MTTRLQLKNCTELFINVPSNHPKNCTELVFLTCKHFSFSFQRTLLSLPNQKKIIKVQQKCT